MGVNIVLYRFRIGNFSPSRHGYKTTTAKSFKSRKKICFKLSTLLAILQVIVVMCKYEALLQTTRGVYSVRTVIPNRNNLQCPSSASFGFMPPNLIKLHYKCKQDTLMETEKQEV